MFQRERTPYINEELQKGRNLKKTSRMQNFFIFPKVLFKAKMIQIIGIWICLVQLLIGQSIKIEKIYSLGKISEEIRSPVSLNIHPLGKIIIGDNFANMVFQIDPDNLTVKSSSTASSDVILSNPLKICSNPLFILVLDVDNQNIFRFDNYLRFVGIMTEDQLRLQIPFTNIQDVAMDGQNNIYLLDGNDFTIYKLDVNGKYSYSIGGSQSAELEFQYVKEIHESGNNEFITYDYSMEKLIQFDVSGRTKWTLSLKGKHVLDFTSNKMGLWTVLIKNKIYSLLIGQGREVLGEFPVFELTGSEVIDLALHPYEKHLWILTHSFLYKINLQFIGK